MLAPPGGIVQRTRLLQRVDEDFIFSDGVGATNGQVPRLYFSSDMPVVFFFFFFFSKSFESMYARLLWF